MICTFLRDQILFLPKAMISVQERYGRAVTLVALASLTFLVTGLVYRRNPSKQGEEDSLDSKIEKLKFIKVRILSHNKAVRKYAQHRFLHKEDSKKFSELKTFTEQEDKTYREAEKQFWLLFRAIRDVLQCLKAPDELTDYQRRLLLDDDICARWKKFICNNFKEMIKELKEEKKKDRQSVFKKICSINETIEFLFKVRIFTIRNKKDIDDLKKIEALKYALFYPGPLQSSQSSS